jgi:hypothetical protein
MSYWRHFSIYRKEDVLFQPKIRGVYGKFKNQPRPLLRPRSVNFRQHCWNLSHETVPLNIIVTKIPYAMLVQYSRVPMPSLVTSPFNNCQTQKALPGNHFLDYWYFTEGKTIPCYQQPLRGKNVKMLQLIFILVFIRPLGCSCPGMSLLYSVFSDFETDKSVLFKNTEKYEQEWRNRKENTEQPESLLSLLIYKAYYLSLYIRRDIKL